MKLLFVCLICIASILPSCGQSKMDAYSEMQLSNIDEKQEEQKDTNAQNVLTLASSSDDEGTISQEESWELQAYIKEPFYYGDIIANHTVVVEKLYESGKTETIHGFSIPGLVIDEKIYDDMWFKVKTDDFGETTLLIQPIRVKQIHTTYKDKLYEGDHIDVEKTVLTAEFDDGTKKEIAADLSEIKATGSVTRDMIFIVNTELGNAEVVLPIIPITQIDVAVQEDLTEGEKIEVSNITLKYEDGKEVSFDDKALEDKLGDVSVQTGTAVEGENTIQIFYGNGTYEGTVEAKAKSTDSLTPTPEATNESTQED